MKANEQQLVFSFGEFDLTDQWYAHKDGVRIKCNEKIIDHLYWQWIIDTTAKRKDDDHYFIYTSGLGLSLPRTND